GTGKSRTATEFCSTAIASLDLQDPDASLHPEDAKLNAELKTKLEHAWVFLVSLENGTCLLPGEESGSTTAVGLRMLHQLLSDSELTLVEINRLYEAPEPIDILSLVS